MTIKQLIEKLSTFHPDQIVNVVVPLWDDDGNVVPGYQSFLVSDVTNFITDRECNYCPVEIHLGGQMSG